MFGFLTVSSRIVGVVYVTLLVLVSLVIAGVVHTTTGSVKRSPVILIPGDGGSQLEAKLDKPRTIHMYCDKKTNNYFNLWLNPNLLIPGIIDCWVDNMRLVYNHSTRATSNSPGVDIRVPGFGNTTTVEWLDPSSMPDPVRRFIMSSYYVDIVNSLVEDGYQRDINIRGAPYDYRRAPNEMKDYFVSLKKLVEQTYAMNAKTKVTLVCHSMGCPVISYFLNRQKQYWKDMHIKGLIGLAGAWAGAVKAMKVIASGENLGIIIVSQTKLRIEQQTSSSLSYLMPSRLVWPKDEVIAMAKDKNYTVQDYEHFFRDINYATGYEMYKDTFSYLEEGLNPPGVEVHCLHGQGLPTPERLDYRKEGSFPDKPSLIYGDGDGTVNLRSMNSCLRWRGKQKQKVYYVPISKLEHLKILSNEDVKSYIKYYAKTW